MSLLEKIASEISGEIPGIDWEALEARFGMPRQELVYHTEGETPDESGAFAYDLFIQAARARAEAELGTIQLTFQVKDDPATSESEIALAMQAWERVQNEEVAIGDVVLRALRSGQTFLPEGDTFEVDRETFRAMVSSVYLIGLYGTLIHLKKLMQFQELSGEQIVKSADDVTRMFNALAILGEEGALDALRPRAAGVVQAPVVIAISIAAVFVVGSIAYLYVASQRQASVNKAMELLCADAIRTGDEDAKERCAELVKMNSVATKGPTERMVLSIGQAALMVAGAYALVMIIPAIPKFFRRKA